MKTPDLSDLMDRLGHRFGDPDLLNHALTHASASSPARPDNERLEFLGDRVLGLIVAEALCRLFPDAPEGTLAPRLNALVRRETLADVAVEIDLGRYLHLGRSEATSGGRRKIAILADAMEAVIAALYLDAGLDRTRHRVEALWGDRLVAVGKTPVDAKTRLQEWAQARGMEPPRYAMVGRSGPDHAPMFEVQVALNSGAEATGQAGSKKQAEQQAAERLIRKVAYDG